MPNELVPGNEPGRKGKRRGPNKATSVKLDNLDAEMEDVPPDRAKAMIMVYFESVLKGSNIMPTNTEKARREAAKLLNKRFQDYLLERGYSTCCLTQDGVAACLGRRPVRVINPDMFDRRDARDLVAYNQHKFGVLIANGQCILKVLDLVKRADYLIRRSNKVKDDIKAEDVGGHLPPERLLMPGEPVVFGATSDAVLPPNQSAEANLSYEQDQEQEEEQNGAMPPGYLLARWMRDFDQDRETILKLSHLSEKDLDAILRGKRRLLDWMFQGLEQATGIPYGTWKHLEDEYWGQ